MYNGIGLQTARGSGTNGFVQRNLSHVRVNKDRTDYKPDEEQKKLEAYMARKGNAELLMHERKRKIELECAEMEDMMAEQGYSQKEIDHKVAKFRKQKLDKLNNSNSDSFELEVDKLGKPM